MLDVVDGGGVRDRTPEGRLQTQRAAIEACARADQAVRIARDAQALALLAFGLAVVALVLSLA
jgi:hypothetical protein